MRIIQKLLALRKRATLAIGNSLTGRFYIETVDRDDPGVERNAMSDIPPEILALPIEERASIAFQVAGSKSD